MRKIVFGVLALAYSVVAAQAGQWDDAIQYQDTNDRAPYLPSVAPTTDLFLLSDALACGGTQLPGYFEGWPCTRSGEVKLNLNQFARQRDLMGLTDQLASLGSEFSAMKAQFAQALRVETRNANMGTAQALAMAGTTDLQSDENYAVSMNVGTYGGQTAFAGGAAARLSQHVSFNAGVTASVNGGPVGARAGIRFGW